MVRVAQLKSRQRKLELARAMAAAASADDIAKTMVTRATAWATAASQAEGAAKASYEMEISLSLFNSSSFDLERFIATAEAVDAAQAPSTAAAKVLSNATSRFGGISIQ